MKTLIEYAISCGNENSFPFKNENCFGFTNENHSVNGNETIRFEKNENKKNESRITHPKNRRNEPTLHTKWGTAKINPNNKYYTIISGEYHNKLLHRLIFEDFYGFIPENHVIHHKDGNRYNNCLLNLQLLSFKEHLLLHYKQGDFTNTDINYCIEESRKQNTTGYFRVSKSKCNQCKQGFIYRYQYYDKNYNKKAIQSTDLKKLEHKVKAKKLPWRKIQ